MDLQAVLKEFNRTNQKKEGGEVSKMTDLEKREWAVMEIVRLWLANGVGKKNSRIRDSKPRRMKTHIRAMLNKVEKHWFEFLELIDSDDKGLFRIVLKKNIPELYRIYDS